MLALLRAITVPFYADAAKGIERRVRSCQSGAFAHAGTVHGKVLGGHKGSTTDVSKIKELIDCNKKDYKAR